MRAGIPVCFVCSTPGYYWTNNLCNAGMSEQMSVLQEGHPGNSERIDWNGRSQGREVRSQVSACLEGWLGEVWTTFTLRAGPSYLQ